MGKKKTAKKTKELSVAIAESSSIGSEPQQQQTPRKRGRPRKVVERTESEEIKEEHTTQEAEVPGREVTEESESKKVKMSEEEKEELQQQMMKEVAPPSSSAQGELPKEPPRSRARRKSKPRKSS